MAIRYKDAGVDIDAGAELIRRIGPLAASTRRPEVLDGLGGFAGACALPHGMSDPVLVSGTDGVGTKLKVAFAAGRHDTVGIDLVAMCVNDVLCTGARPLFFLDYFAVGALDVDVAERVIAGIAEGCRQSGCALLGGETAELPGFYSAGEYDLAGFSVGVVERGELRDGSQVRAGDALIGLPSSGLHSNGYSLARKALFEHLGLALDSRPDALQGTSLADALLCPTRIYAAPLAALERAGVSFHGAAHITGGGMVENVPRMWSDEKLVPKWSPDAWDVPAIFPLIESAGIEPAEMARTFNMGIGFVVAVAQGDVQTALRAMSEAGARDIGVVGEK